jgi:hypothetical protein
MVIKGFLGVASGLNFSIVFVRREVAASNRKCPYPEALQYKKVYGLGSMSPPGNKII